MLNVFVQTRHKMQKRLHIYVVDYQHGKEISLLLENNNNMNFPIDNEHQPRKTSKLKNE